MTRGKQTSQNKLTVFNKLTGLNQHTGNWPGKTVANAQGTYTFQNKSYKIVDIPGTYSLMAHSAEEEVARDFICFGDVDVAVVVCDATCLERNMNLVLQTIEIMKNVIVCVNLMDEAKKKKISVDFEKLESNLGVPVIGANATRGAGLDRLIQTIANMSIKSNENEIISIKYTACIEEAIGIIEPVIRERLDAKLNARWVSLKLLEEDQALIAGLNRYERRSIIDDPKVSDAVNRALGYLENNGISRTGLKDEIVSGIVRKAEEVCRDSVIYHKTDYNERDRKIDRILTNKLTGIPLMLMMLSFVFWLTITGSNYPSKLLSEAFFRIQEQLLIIFNYFGAPQWLTGMLVLGVYRVSAWVVAVMLPPMAIFFPLFTLLEDLGYLPRVAFNLDNQFKKCRACGKQALTMCMGFGCNAAGVVGCRIIDSPRERLIAIITNSFVPCNGRFAPPDKEQQKCSTSADAAGWNFWRLVGRLFAQDSTRLTLGINGETDCGRD